MSISNYFEQSKILETAMQATQYKNQVILNNIANADTPGYKSKSVEFKSILKDAIETEKTTGISQLDSVMSKISLSANSNFSNRLDENGVDMETEMVEFYKNSIEYDVIVNSVQSNLNINNSVLSIFR